MSMSSGFNRVIRTKSVDIDRRLGDSTEAYDMTHVLRIPFATSVSWPQFHRSLLCAKSDSTASNIHPKAFGTPDTRFLTLCSLSLKTVFDIQRAKEMLEDIRMNDSLYKRLQPETDPSSPSPFLVHAQQPLICPCDCPCRRLICVRKGCIWAIFITANYRDASLEFYYIPHTFFWQKSLLGYLFSNYPNTFYRHISFEASR